MIGVSKLGCMYANNGVRMYDKYNTVYVDKDCGTDQAVTIERDEFKRLESVIKESFYINDM